MSKERLWSAPDELESAVSWNNFDNARIKKIRDRFLNPKIDTSLEKTNKLHFLQLGYKAKYAITLHTIKTSNNNIFFTQQIRIRWIKVNLKK